MRVIDQSVPCAPNDMGSLLRSREKEQEWKKMLNLLRKMTVVLPIDKVVRFSIETVAPGLPSRAQEHLAVASELGVGDSTVHGWDSGASGVGSPSLLIYAAGSRFKTADEVAIAYEDFVRARRGDIFPWLIGGSE